MFCHKCGAQLSDDSLFCSKCGASLSNTDEQTETTPCIETTVPPANTAASVPEESSNPSATTKQKKLAKPLLIVIIALALCAAIFGISLLIGFAQSTNLTVTVPDPRVYFNMPMTIDYTYAVTYSGVPNTDAKAYDLVMDYVELLINQYGFYVDDNNRFDDGSASIDLMYQCNSPFVHLIEGLFAGWYIPTMYIEYNENPDEPIKVGIYRNSVTNSIPIQFIPAQVHPAV